MFDNMFQIVNGPDGQHFYVHTDSYVVAVLLVIALFLAILLSSAICYCITRFILLKIVSRLARGEQHKWLRAAERRKVFDRLAPLVPAIIVYLSAPLLTGVSFPVISALGPPVETLSACFIVLTILRAAFAFLSSIEDRYSHFPFASQSPIKSFLQIATIVLYVLALIAAISLLLRRSPANFLTGVSAMTALLIIIFRDSLLGFVASIQLAAYDMLRVGDWIEVPGFVADGTVIDISLNTIKVRNFDNSIVMLPSYVLLTNSVKNWRGMVESGGRRVKHAIHMDIESIRFCDDVASVTPVSTSKSTPSPTLVPASLFDGGAGSTTARTRWTLLLLLLLALPEGMFAPGADGGGVCVGFCGPVPTTFGAAAVCGTAETMIVLLSLLKLASSGSFAARSNSASPLFSE